MGYVKIYGSTLVSAAFYYALSQSPSLKSLSLARIEEFGEKVCAYINDNEPFNAISLWFSKGYAKDNLYDFLDEHSDLFELIETKGCQRLKFKKPCTQVSFINECKEFIYLDNNVRPCFSKVANHFRFVDEESYT